MQPKAIEYGRVTAGMLFTYIEYTRAVTAECCVCSWRLWRSDLDAVMGGLLTRVVELRAQIKVDYEFIRMCGSE